MRYKIDGYYVKDRVGIPISGTNIRDGRHFDLWQK